MTKKSTLTTSTKKIATTNPKQSTINNILAFANTYKTFCYNDKNDKFGSYNLN